MDFVRPGFNVPGTQGPLTPPESETGMELEAALPVPTVRESVASVRTALDEPSGAFASLAPEASEHSSALKPSSPYASIEERFEHVLATVRESRPQDDLELIRRAWAFCVQQHEGQ